MDPKDLNEEKKREVAELFKKSGVPDLTATDQHQADDGSPHTPGYSNYGQTIKPAPELPQAPKDTPPAAEETANKTSGQPAQAADVNVAGASPKADAHSLPARDHPSMKLGPPPREGPGSEPPTNTPGKDRGGR